MCLFPLCVETECEKDQVAGPSFLTPPCILKPTQTLLLVSPPDTPAPRLLSIRKNKNIIIILAPCYINKCCLAV